MFCIKCGSPITEGNSFCIKCGAKVEDSEEPKTPETVSTAQAFCINCGNPLAQDDSFCIKCGTKVEGPASNAAQPLNNGVQTAFDSFSQDYSTPQMPTSFQAGYGSQAAQGWSAEPVGQESKGKGKKPLIIVLVILIVAALAAGGAFAYFNFVAPNNAASSTSEETTGTSEDTDSASETTTSGATEISVSLKSNSSLSSSVFTLASASSELAPSSYGNYYASNVLDGNAATAWVEGVSGAGTDETLTLSSASGAKEIATIEILNGYNKSEATYTNNDHPRQITILADDGTEIGTVTLSDVYNKTQVITFPSVSTSSVTLRIDSAYTGLSYQDCGISEVRVY